jgi:hypothetical protein
MVGSALYRLTTLAFDQSNVSTANPYDYNPLLTRVPDMFTSSVFTAVDWKTK